MDKRHPAPGHPLSRIRMLGDCDHGVWHAAGTKIVTDHDVEIPLRGVQPANTLYFESNQGDAIAVQVAGNPAVTRSPAELAADHVGGRTWLDYGILAGGARRLYGQALGDRTWIYCPDDGSRWLATIGERSPTQITLQPFGHIPGDPAADALPIQAVPLEFESMPDEYAGPPFTDLVFNTLDDVRDDGRGIIVSVGYHYAQSNLVGSGLRANWGFRWPYGIYHVSISGIPPAATASVTPMYAGDALGFLDAENNRAENTFGIVAFQDISSPTFYYLRDTGEPIVPPPDTTQVAYWERVAGDFDGWDEYILGGCFVDDVATPVILRKAYDVSSNLEFEELGPEAGFTGVQFVETYTATSIIQLKIGASVLSTTAASGGRKTGWFTFEPGSPVDTNTPDKLMLDGVLEISSRPRADAADYTISGTPADLSHHEIMPTRMGNRCWALCMINLGVLDPADGGFTNLADRGWGGHTHVGFVSPTAVVKTLVQRPAELERAVVTGYASAHPITGEIAWSFDHPVGWV